MAQAGIWRGASIGAFGAGIVIPGIQFGINISSKNYTNAAFNVVDIGAAYVGTYGGPNGLGLSVLYFGTRMLSQLPVEGPGQVYFNAADATGTTYGGW